jgi:hypothetical protein
MRRSLSILPLLLALAACEVEPASNRASDTSASADVGADVQTPDVQNPSGCPATDPAPNGVCLGDDTCRYGQECCCGECSASFVCTCAGGHWACYYTDFCMRPDCGDASTPDAGGEIALDVGFDAAPVDTAEPDADAGGDTWVDDLGGDTSATCPVEAPLGVQGSCEAGQRCEYGEECCCGACSPSMVCACSGGAWGCHSTDFCMIPGCPDDAPPDGLCRTAADCEMAAGCRDADDPSPCGICRHPEITCEADVDCEAGWVCETVQPPALCLCEVTRLCQPACGPDLPCPSGQACAAGHCAPAPCDADADCAPFFACSADGPTCARLDCAVDADCGPGRCVNARCFDDFGVCQLPVP